MSGAAEGPAPSYRQTPSSYWKAEPSVLEVRLQAGRKQCRVPAGESGLGGNVQAGPAGSLPPTLARDGGLGPFNV